jgi:ComF family protein
MIPRRIIGLLRKAPTFIRRLIRLLPSECFICKNWTEQAFCADCLIKYHKTIPRCHTCARPLSVNVQCGACLHKTRKLKSCLSVFSYESPWSEVLWKFKYGNHPILAYDFSQLMRATDGVPEILDACDYLLPIPSSNTQLKNRGYHQTLLLAEQLAPEKIAKHLLMRQKKALAQFQLKRKDRLINMRDVFAVPTDKLEHVLGKNILLLDDVMTTGATIDDAFRALMLAKAKSVSALVLMRTHEN